MTGWRALGVAAIVGAGVALAGAPQAAQQDCQIVEDFSKGAVGAFPPEWKPRKDAGKEVYRIAEDGGRRLLRAVARGVGIQAAKQLEWNLSTHPVLTWSWRPREFPQGADERESSKNDSAVSVYAVFPHSPVSVKSLKYIWSERVPAGTRLTSSKGLTQVRVLRSGADGRGTWVEERVNVLEDYRKLFGEDPAKPAGIAVLTDADETKSTAEGDYAAFRICRE